MKRFATLFLTTFCFFGFASAQSFTISAPEIWTIAPHDNPDVEGHLEIHNTTQTTQTIKWERTVIDVTDGCLSQVCDLNLCWIASVGTKNFDIAGDARGNIIMHFLNPDTLVGAYGIFRLKFTNVNIPADTVSAVYLFTSELSNTQNPLPAANVRLFPNPTTEYFQLDNAEAVQRVRVFSLASREVANYTALPGELYSLSGLPAGAYVVALEDEQGRVFQALEVVKR